MDAPRQASHLSQHLLNPLQWQDTSVFRQRLNVPAAPPALGQGGWGPRGQGLGGYNQGPGGGMGIYQGAGQGYPDTGMGIRGGYQGGFPGGGGVNQDLPFYRGQPPPDYGGYQVSAQMFNHQLETISWGEGRWVNINHYISIFTINTNLQMGQYPGRQQFLPQQQQVGHTWSTLVAKQLFEHSCF